MALTLNGSTGISGIAGSAGTPALQGTDTNTGYFFGTDILGLSTGGSKRLHIDSNGLIANGGLLPSDYGSPNLLISGTDSTVTLMGNGSTNNTSFTGIKFRVAGGSTGDYTKAGIFVRREGSYNDLSLIFALDKVADATSVSIADEKLRIDSDGRVLIGGTSNSASSHADELQIINTSAQGGLSIITADNSQGNIYFGHSGGAADGRIEYIHNGDYMRFYTANDERTRIDSSGRVIIGGGSHGGGANLVVKGIDGTTPNTYAAAAFCRIGANPTSDTALVNLRFSGGATGTNRAAEITVKTDSNWNDGTSQESKMIFTVASSGGGNTAGNPLLTLKGTGDVEVNRGNLVLASTKGIDFSATADAGASASNIYEILDDYEEGYFTPNIQPVTSGSITWVGTADLLSYTKIGRIVHIKGMLEVDSVSSPTGITRGTLPFAQASLTDESERTSGVCIIVGTNIAAGSYALYPNGGTDSYLEPIRIGNSADIERDVGSYLGAGDKLYFSYTYQASA